MTMLSSLFWPGYEFETNLAMVSGLAGGIGSLEYGDGMANVKYGSGEGRGRRCYLYNDGASLQQYFDRVCQLVSCHR